MKLFDDMLEAWRYTRDGVVAELENIPDGLFESRPAGLLRSSLDLSNHIVESGRLMSGELSLPHGDFRRKKYDEIIAEHLRPGDIASSRKEAIAALKRSYKEGDAMLRGAGAELLMQEIRQFNGVYASRLSWMHHGVAHEEYHRGQLAVYARFFGLTPALTRLIEG